MARWPRDGWNTAVISAHTQPPDSWRSALAIAAAQLALASLAWVVAVQEVLPEVVIAVSLTAMAWCVLGPVFAVYRSGFVRGALSQVLFLAGIYVLIGLTAEPSCGLEMSINDVRSGLAVASSAELPCSWDSIDTAWDTALCATSIATYNALFWLSIGALTRVRRPAPAPADR